MNILLEKIVENIITSFTQVNMGRLEKAINGTVWTNSKYGIELIELLSNNSIYNEFSDHIQYLGNGGGQIGIKNLADWLIERAYDVGSIQSVQELNNYLELDNIEVYEVSLLANIHIHNNHRNEYYFCNGVRLIDASTIPNKNVSLNILHDLYNSILPFPKVENVLIKAFSQKKLHQSSYSETLISPNIESPLVDLEETRLCMILARQLGGVHSIASVIIAPDNLPFIQSFSGWRMNSFKMPTIFGYMLDVELDSVNNILKRYRLLDVEFKDKLKISIDSFNGYCSLSTLEERAISLRTCLESIFIGNKEEQIGFKLRIRAALFLGNNFEEQQYMKKILKDTYKITSSAVHNGRISEKDMKNIKILDKSANFARKAIIKLINEGQVDWKDLEL